MRLKWTKKLCNSISGGGDVMLIVFIILQYYIFANKEKIVENKHSLCEEGKKKLIFLEHCKTNTIAFLN
jgi:hypothetical protein